MCELIYESAQTVSLVDFVHKDIRNKTKSPTYHLSRERRRKVEERRDAHHTNEKKILFWGETYT